MSKKPLILVHGLWDKPSLFKMLFKRLRQKNIQFFTPYLPHKLGSVPISHLAKDLDDYILSEFGEEVVIDLLGFSMGGLISRFWLQKMNGFRRTNRFISIGSPHEGTLLARMVPSGWLSGIADMKPGSGFLNELNTDFHTLKEVDCISFFCRWDFMVIPGCRAVLPVGKSFPMPVCTHKGLITHPRAVEILIQHLL